MPGFSNYLENKVLDHCFGGSAFTQPTPYLALFTAVTDAEAGTGTEVTGGSYARVSLAAAFAAAASGSKALSGNVDFTQATASWGTITHVGIFDASSGGNALSALQALSASVAIGNGDIYRQSTLTLTLD